MAGFRYLFPNQQQNQQQVKMMDKFRQSRRASKRKESPMKIQGLSPQKFGRAAFMDMQYTPSKLAQNCLFKDVNSLKKYEETSQKLRQVEASYKLLEDKYNKIVKEKTGVQDSLTRQIEMYKSLIQEMEDKAEARLKAAQEAFKNQIQVIVAEKEEEVKFVQAEKQQLEQTIAQLEEIGNQLQERLSRTTGQLKQALGKIEFMQKELTNLNQRLEAAQQHQKAQSEKAEATIENLKEKIIQTQSKWRDKLDATVRQKDLEARQLEKSFKQQIKSINQERQQDRKSKHEQIKILTQKFETETKRLNQVISAKEKMVEELNEKSKQEGNKLNSAIRGYQQQITSLANQKARLFQEVDALNEENTHLNVLLKDQQIMAAKQKGNLQAFILKLKDDINYSQTNFLRERDRNVYHKEDNTKQLISLKKEIAELQRENENLRSMTRDSDTLSRQVRKLRDTLMESSFQLQKCRDQFMKLAKERDLLAIRLEETSYENGNLRRIKYEREEEAKSWRDSYYLTRSRRR